jgi:stearoyl-CoA desaturase (delta-9 desaturase)
VGADRLSRGPTDTKMAVAQHPSQAAPGSASVVDAVQPVSHETLDRTITGLVTLVPFLLLGLAGWQLWNQALRWSDVTVFAIVYQLTGIGVTVGFHRLLTHRSFATSPALRGVFAALGSAAIEGPVISWVADHRKHHACSDHEGDPHSPHVDHGDGWRGVIRGLFHAHLGWLFIHTQRGSKDRFAPDLLCDPVVRAIDRSFLLWAVLGLALPFGLGVAIGGSVVAGLTGLLWGGAVRVFVLHHVTYSINSLCHMFGQRRFPTNDESRNLFWLALPTLGEAWHNNHHAFPTSAEHGLRRWEIDPSALLIRVLERAGLVWDVVRIRPERQAAKAIQGTATPSNP